MARTSAGGGGATLDTDALVQLAIERADDDPYVTLLFLLLAQDHGEGAAAVELETLRTARLVSPEDETLARFQLALLHLRGVEVAADPKRARAHLRAAARSAGWNGKLPSDLEHAVDRVREAIGLPSALDPTRPLGPAMPGRPGWLRHDHHTAPPFGPLPRSVGRRVRRVPEAPTEQVYGLAISRDGRMLASGGIGGEVLIWDVARKRPVRRGPNPGGAIEGLSFGATGRYLAFASDDLRRIPILDLDTDELVHLKGLREQVYAVAFHTHAPRLFSGDAGGVIHEWDMQTGKRARSMEQKSSPWSLVVSPDGASLYAGLEDDVVRIDLRAWTVDQTFSAHSHLVHGLALSPDGSNLVSASRDAFVAVWDVHTGALLHFLSDHTDCVYGAVFAPSGRVVSAGLDGRVLVFDLEAGSHDELDRGESNLGIVAHGRTVAVGGNGGVQFFEVD